jgi:serine/threonine-protein kinase PknG
MRCERDCPGTIVDGYCDTCGMAPAKNPARQPGTAAAPSSAASQPGTAPSGGQEQDVATAPVSTRTEAASGPSQRTVAASARSGALSTRTGNSARSGSGRSASRRRFGSGLVEVAPREARDPASAVMDVAEVPEERRFCGSCGNPVGRTRDDRPGRSSGFCPSCGEPFDLTPKLVKGDLVAGQYEVVGALAHGGLGWIHLAIDKNVSDRWVVLKGLLNSGSRDAQAAAVAERRFLAEVEHPNIVRIYNFVQHDGAGYIVMEYVGGESLKDILKARIKAAGHADPLPVEQAIAYVLEVLPAFTYLHDRGLIYCDFKPDNVIQSGDQVRLIDLGGVVHLDDDNATLYGTVGYQAPEIAERGPSPQSDLYTIGRTLAVLTTDFRGYQTTFRDSLPERSDFAVYRDHESFYRLVRRATQPDPRDRFVDAAELAEQLLGVLREVLAAAGEPRPAASRLFTGELRTDARGDGPEWRFLPQPLIDLADPAAAFLASVTLSDPREVLALLGRAPEQTLEVQLRALRAYIDIGPDGFPYAARMIADLGDDWRVAWHDGLLALASGDFTRARERFDAVYSALPGELAPQLALGLTLELAGDPGAAGYYDVVSRTDPAYTTAAAGLARCRIAAGDRDGAVEAYHRVPGTSAAFHSARIGAVRALVSAAPEDQDDVAALVTAAGLIGQLDAGASTAALRAELLERVLTALGKDLPVPAAALEGMMSASPQPASGGTGTTGNVGERDVRFALEGAYREMARAARGDEKIRLVDMANAARPRTRT